MLTYKLITQDEYDNFLQLLLNEAADYLSHTLELMQMSLEEAQALFRATGQVFAIYQDAALAGYYWIEERGDILHLHGLVLRQECQGQGIGSQVPSFSGRAVRPENDGHRAGRPPIQCESTPAV